MDLGVTGHENGAPATKLGSLLSKQERSGEDEWRNSSNKLARTTVEKEDDPSSKTLSFHQGIPVLRSSNNNNNSRGFLVEAAGGSDSRTKEQMLSFSSSDKSQAKESGFEQRSSVLPYLQQISSSYTRDAGYGAGGMNATSMHGNFTGVRGPFTLSQWVELETQALIYKYITANVPVPTNLLLSLKKSFYPFALSSSSPGSLPPNSLGWGSFHLGFSGSTDPEPGRCRRTDGKKWRCSRDAVPDQKYCERHINRGRHRSRKPVEGQTGHAAAASSAGPTISKVVVPMMTSSVTSSSIIGGRNAASNSLATGVAANPSADSLANRVQNPRGPSVYASTMNLQAKESSLTLSKQSSPFEDSLEFGLVSSDSLLNPSHKNPYMNSSKNYGSYLDFNDQDSQDQQNPLRQFMDGWPKDHSNNHSVISWPDELKSDWTQLSMSIPIASSSPAQDKLALSPLRLSREFDSEISESTKKLNNWIPISWGSSLGGPLGEVLTSTTNSPRLGSSPTGVLQKSAFGSLSNSSSGSSPVGENKKASDGVGLRDDLLGSTLLSTSVPPL